MFEFMERFEPEIACMIWMSKWTPNLTCDFFLKILKCLDYCVSILKPNIMQILSYKILKLNHSTVDKFDKFWKIKVKNVILSVCSTCMILEIEIRLLNKQIWIFWNVGNLI